MRNELIEQLIHRHPDHVKYRDRWILLDKMTRGGHEMDLAAKKQLLVSPNCRSQDVIEERANLASYYSLTGMILTRLQSHLLSAKSDYTLTGNTQIKDSFWDDIFFPTGVLDKSGRKSFRHGLKEAVLSAFSQGVAIAQIDTSFGVSSSKSEQDALKADQPYVVLRKRQDLWDWCVDEKGLIFAKLHCYRTVKKSWDSLGYPEHEFLVYHYFGDKALVNKYRVSPSDPDWTAKHGSEYFDIEKLPAKELLITVDFEDQPVFYLENKTGMRSQIPIAILEFDSSLWIADQLYESQKAYFNQTAAIEWALLSTNYAQLVFTDVDDEESLKERLEKKAGDGYYWALPLDVKAGWLERNGQGIDRALEYRNTKKAEMLETISQIAVGVASGYSVANRSGESKKEDRRNLDILLEVYGQSIADYVKSILDMSAIARGTDSTWTVEGYSNYDSDSLLEDLDQYEAVSKAINSETFRKESQSRIVARAIEELSLDASIKDKVVEEILDNSFSLSDRQLDFLQDLSNIGRLSNRGLLEIIKRLGILPIDFDIDAELNRIDGSLDPNP